MNITQALRSLLSARFGEDKAVPSGATLGAVYSAGQDTSLTGPGFVAQEPELSKELHLTGRDISGWSMGGSNISD